jgi:hypothetical protein
MMTFLTGPGALWAMSALCTLQMIACLLSGAYPQAAIMFGYLIADLGLIWSMPQ